MQTLRLGGKPYVLVPAKEFQKVLDRLASYDEEERRDVAIVRKRLKSKRPLIPLAKIKEELGL
jgi:hypothetical protein